jgi:F0F1-type ATP synthase delta subunit
MKYAPHTYAKALVAVLDDAKGPAAGHDAEIAKNFLALVRKNGDEAHLLKILEEASRFARGKSGIRKVTIASAREMSVSQNETVGQFVRLGDVVERRIDPDLIAGIKITVNDEMQFDGSLKNKLNKALGAV